MAQIDMFDERPSKPETKKIKNGEFLYIPSFYNKTKSNLFLKTFSESIKWEQEKMKVYGKIIDFPRLTAWYGDNNKKYSFSGIQLMPNDWTTELLEIRNDIAEVSKSEFNSVLLNLYRDGNDSISWHTDAEKELGQNPIIVSLNFGATRKFQLRHKETKQKIELELSHGSLLIMQGEIQHYWQHQVPKTKRAITKRINLSFRLIK